MEPERSRRAFDGHLISVAVETWPAGEREVVHHPGAAAIVARTSEGQVVLVRQLREAVRARLLEIPAGVRDVDGEDTALTAARELHEETGYRASNVRALASILTSPGFADERIDLFVAEAVPGDGSGGEPGVEVVLLPLDACLAAIRSGAIVDAKTVAALLLAAEGPTGRAEGPGYPEPPIG